MKRMFFVRAVWDEEAGVFYSESDIFGLHIEAATVDEFESVLNEVAVDLIISNHYSAQDIATKPMKDLVPAILWQRPATIPAAA